LRFAKNLCKHFFIPESGISNVLAEFDKINGILAGDFLGVKGPEAKKCFTAHICSQPVAVAVFADIPEIFLLHADAVDGFNQAAGKKIGKRPDNLVDFLVEQFKIGIGLMLLYKRPRLFGGIT
jgi:hypothetical protein